MEDLGQTQGFVHYRTTVTGPRPSAPLRLDGPADRAQVFRDGAEVGVLHRDGPTELELAEIPAAGAVLELLVENCGRINYGPRLADRKGIAGVRLDYQQPFGWEIRPLPLTDLSGLRFVTAGLADTGSVDTGSGDTDGAGEFGVAGPRCYRAHLDGDQPADGFLAFPTVSRATPGWADSASAGTGTSARSGRCTPRRRCGAPVATRSSSWSCTQAPAGRGSTCAPTWTSADHRPRGRHSASSCHGKLL